LLFVAGMIVCGILCNAIFLQASQLPTQTWYYIAILGFLAAALDAAVDLLIAGKPALRTVRLLAVVLTAAAILPQVWGDAHIRMTNIDLIAKKLETAADSHDLIVFLEFWPGVTFNRYYHGVAPWTTLPEISDMRIQRFDLLKEKMAEEQPLQPLKKKVEDTLKGGHRLWLVGSLPDYDLIRIILEKGHQLWIGDSWPPLRPDEPPPPIPQGPMHQAEFHAVWARQMTRWLQDHETKYEFIEVPVSDPIMPFEDYPLFAAKGWRP
jgi:hypothetical protein